jgi:TerC family integral membrane protein
MVPTIRGSSGVSASPGLVTGAMFGQNCERQGGEYSLATVSSARLARLDPRFPTGAGGTGGSPGTAGRRAEPAAEETSGVTLCLPEVMPVHVSFVAWIVTLVTLVVILGADLLIIGRRPHEPKLRESALWVTFYLGLAAAFGLGVLVFSGAQYGGEFFAGWLTEYSLSVDNLFVFVVIMARFRVPRALQQKALLIGIVLALVMRGAFIAAGAAAISRFDWVFYLFGAFLIYTAINLARQRGVVDTEFSENRVIRWARRVLPVTRDYRRAQLFTRKNGRVHVTPMLVVMIALGTTDLVFALDSIPAIFGLTEEAYLVFTANVFALMGLRQLYFLLGGLLQRLTYLSLGLAVVLGFIGLKLVLEALHNNDLRFINGGRGVSWAPHIPIWVSLLVIIGTLTIATIASLLRSHRREPVSPVP